MCDVLCVQYVVQLLHERLLRLQIKDGFPIAGDAARVGRVRDYAEKIISNRFGGSILCIGDRLYGDRTEYSGGICVGVFVCFGRFDVAACKICAWADF